MRPVNVLLALIVAVATRSAAAPSPPLVITDVTVDDPVASAPQPHMTVVIVGGRIRALGPAGQVAVPRGARVVAAAGKFLIPGLWDMHGHLSDATESAFPLLIANGVTGVRDLGGNLEQLDRWRAEIARGTRLGPLIVRAGPFVDGPKDVTENRLAVTDPAVARHAVDSLVARGVDCIKVHNALPRDAFFAVMSEARKLHVPVAVHLPHGITVTEASDSGAASLEHIEMMIESAIYRPGSTVKTWDEALSESKGEAGARIFATFLRNHTWYDPTLSAYYRGFVLWEPDTAKIRKRRLALGKLIELTRDMHKAGVPLLAGSDFTAADHGVRPGVDLHQELTMLVEAGLTPREAIQCATINPARFLGMQDSLGTIEPGKRADLVLLSADPFDNINNSRTIEHVILNGRLIELPPPRLAPPTPTSR
jgi:imidazolonepropionase-like amidohydrolase